MTNSQGTQWETEILKRAGDYGLTGLRYPKRAQKHEPDLYLNHVGVLSLPPHGVVQLGIVAWKRLTGKKSGKPRTPDGERRVVVLEFDDFLRLVSHSRYDYHVEVQAKWAAALNPTRTLGGLRSWMKGVSDGNPPEDTGL
jgi:hypothetical protein